jgi:hypothetical protein
MENCQSSEQAPKNAQSPSRPVHLRRTGTSYFTKETGAQWEYTANWQTHKPYTAVETRMSQSRGAPWFPVRMIHPLVAWRLGAKTPIRKLFPLSDRVCPLTDDESWTASFLRIGATPFVVNLPVDSSSQILYLCFLERCVGHGT